MAKVVCAVVVVLAYFMLAESLTCNKCSVGLLGVCLNSDNVTCSTNTSVCFTARVVFPSITSFVGFNSQGCQEPSLCVNSSAALLGANYTSTVACCSTDNCNPVTIISGATTTKLSMVAVVASAVLASAWSTL